MKIVRIIYATPEAVIEATDEVIRIHGAVLQMLAAYDGGAV